MISLNGVDTTKKPDFVTAKVEWWRCVEIETKELPNVRGWVVKDKHGWNYVITDGQRFEYGTQSFEAALVHIDIMLMQRRKR